MEDSYIVMLEPEGSRPSSISCAVFEHPPPGLRAHSTQFPPVSQKRTKNERSPDRQPLETGVRHSVKQGRGVVRKRSVIKAHYNERCLSSTIQRVVSAVRAPTNTCSVSWSGHTRPCLQIPHFLPLCPSFFTHGSGTIHYSRTAVAPVVRRRTRKASTTRAFLTQAVVL